MIGVAPNTPLRAVKVLERKGSGSVSSVICGIDWVTANSSTIKVANMSIGGWNDGLRDDGNCGRTIKDLYHQAICNSTAAGVTYAVAAGNDTWALEDTRWTAVPAAYDEVLAVTAMADSNGAAGGTWKTPSGCTSSATEDKFASFSNWATPPAGTPDWTDDRTHTIAAPGVCIKSTYLNGGYRTISGTSMASPHIAGMAALCIASGRCSDTDGDTKMEPSEVMAKLRLDALSKDANNAYGFTGDPNSSSTTGKVYDYLGYAGGY